MEFKVFFSVIIPVFNKERHVKEAILSVLNQTYQDFEIICVNDNSTDASLQIISNISDSRIKIFNRNESGQGGYAARNYGIEKSNGNWIAFLDADDIWMPDHLKKMKSYIKMYPNDLFFTSAWNVHQGDNISINTFQTLNSDQDNVVVDLKMFLKSSIKGLGIAWTSVVVLRNTDLIKDKLFPQDRDIKRGGDLYAWLYIVTRSKRIIWCNYIGATYRMNSDNMVTKNAPASYDLPSYRTYLELSRGLNHYERILLSRYLNLLLSKALRYNYKYHPRMQIPWMKMNWCLTPFSSALIFASMVFLKVSSIVSKEFKR